MVSCVLLYTVRTANNMTGKVMSYYDMVSMVLYSIYLDLIGRVAKSHGYDRYICVNIFEG